MSDFLKKFRTVKTFIFDVDGVLTHGDLLVMNTGELLRTMSIRDGYVLKLLCTKNEYNVAIITGGKSEGVAIRLKNLGIKNVFTNVTSKIEIFKKYILENKIDPLTTLYMGDDIPDYEVMCEVGIPTCPKDACKEIKDKSVYISSRNGGEGCVRDVIEQVLKCQEKWMENNDIEPI